MNDKFKFYLKDEFIITNPTEKQFNSAGIKDKSHLIILCKYKVFLIDLEASKNLNQLESWFPITIENPCPEGYILIPCKNLHKIKNK